jgi:hypothetical protein
MTEQINELIKKIKELEEEIEVEFQKKREDIHFIIEKKRIRFSEELARQQRLFKTGLIRYAVEARPLVVLTAPLIYSGFVPFLLLDLFLFLYQTICFPVYGIPKARRSAYLIFDRKDLPYLNSIERFNCFYCSYANGLAGYFREIAARTEQYWCPIKHARRILAAHDRYPRFFEYGDAESYRKGLERLRKQLEKDEIRQAR